MHWKKVRLLVAASALGLGASIQAAQFTNGGFESGNFSGWTQGQGTWSSGSLPLSAADYLPGGSKYQAVASQSAIVAPGADPIIGAQLVDGGAFNMVYNGQYSARINNSANNYSVNVISQSVTNYTDNKIIFEWAAVLDSSHGATDSDHFALTLRDDTAGTNLVSRVFSSATTGSLFQLLSGGWYASGWIVEEIDLVALNAVGHNFTLSLLAADCPYGGHAGYVYLDGFGSVVVPPDPGGGVPDASSTLLLLGLALSGLGFCRKFATRS